ncbi:gephyrin-like molybdotransferase Glp [Paraglaciecola sp.]|uniref:molybdopterin molybdotransferase MoeA n=1 Tax=Paraglaciecola sp. TaxID=1920173 RepID=UPI00273EDE61|nr:gephyrin-like molybdotransferase Glp [Paraglaciecola sp.]
MSTLEHCDAPGLMPLKSAVQNILSQVTAVSESEVVSLALAHQRVLATDLISNMNVPPADNSAMDGYALRASDLKHTSTLQLIGTALAGQPFTGQIEQGECVRIMTGAVIPQGADAVVMQENTQINNDMVSVTHVPQSGHNIRPAGNDIRLGERVLAKGMCLGPAELALIASIGQADVKVIRPLTVGIMATGDELTPPGQPLKTGAIYESNSYALAAQLQSMKMKVLNYGIVADDKTVLRRMFVQADKECDVIISCGGVSVGEADFVKEILAELGQINFWKVAIKPGKPFAFGQLNKAYFCGLPGNPVSSFVTFEQLVLPLLKTLSGQRINLDKQAYLVAKVAKKVTKRPGRADFQRAFYERDEQGQLWVEAQKNQSSGVMSSISKANCYLLLAQAQGDIEQGELVKILPFAFLH